MSIDGLRPDAIKKAKAKNLLNLIEGGSYFENAYTVRPSLTLPSHTSMLTGLDPKQHGVTWNDYRKELGPIKYKTALEIANDAGLHTAIFVAKDKLLHLNRPSAVDHFEKTNNVEAKEVAQAFERYVEKNGLPDVTFLHLPDPDRKGHFTMWMSPFYLDGVEDADEAVGRVLAAAIKKSRQRPTVLITADHGGSGFNHLADIEVHNHIPFIANGSGIAAGLHRPETIRVYDTAATILSLLGLPVPKDWMGNPIKLD
jgi:predicted AlkP superfamily pyrophosphatase or phosphodiesterase